MLRAERGDAGGNVDVALARTAFHEAGHCAAANDAGIRVECVSIVPDAWLAGFVRGHHNHGPERLAIVYLSGHGAGVALLGLGDMSFQSASQHGAATDFLHASALLGGDVGRMALASASALEVVQRRRSSVDRLALALMRHGVLSETQVRHCMNA